MRWPWIILVPFVAFAAERHVVATGGKTSGAAADSANGWTLTYAASSGTVAAGDTILLHAGTHTVSMTGLTVSVDGTAANPIIFKPVSGQRAIIDGRLAVTGDDIWFVDLEFNHSDTTKEIACMDLHGPRPKVINCKFFNTNGVAIGCWEDAPGAEIYGNIIQYAGWQFQDVSYGHGIYAQHYTDTVRQVIKDNFILDVGGKGIHWYGNLGHADYVSAIGNVIQRSGQLVSIDNYDILINALTQSHPIIDTNYTYRTDGAKSMYYGTTGGSEINDTLRIYGNRISGGVSFNHWNDVQFRGNKIFKRTALFTIYTLASQNAANYKLWDYNTVRQKTTGYIPFEVNEAGVWWTGSFAEWRTRYQRDSNSTYITPAADYLTGVETFVRPNIYESGRANLVAYNWDGLDTVKFSTAGVFADGDTIACYNTQNYFGDSAFVGVIVGDTLKVPFGSDHWTAATPPAGIAALPSTFPTFGSFVAYSVTGQTPSEPEAVIVTIANSITGFGNVYVDSTSTGQSYTVSGTGLSGDITIISPANFTISKDSSAWDDTLTCVQSGGVVAVTTIYVRFIPTAATSYSGDITHNSTGADERTVALSGTGINLTPSIALGASTMTFTTAKNVSSDVQLCSLVGTALENDVTVTCPATFEISKDGVEWATSLTYTNMGGDVSGTVRVRYSPTTYGSSSGNVSFVSIGATTQNVSATGTCSAPRSLLIRRY